MSGGFGLCGNAEHCIAEIARRGVKNLTIISNNCGNQGQGLAVLLKNAPGGARDLQLHGRQPRPGRAIRWPAPCRSSWSPRGRSPSASAPAGAGIAGFFTPTGVGTVVAEGKEVREIDGRQLRSGKTAARRLRHRAGGGGRSRRQPALLPDGPRLQPAGGHGGRRDRGGGGSAGGAGRARSRRCPPARPVRRPHLRGARAQERHRVPDHPHPRRPEDAHELVQGRHGPPGGGRDPRRPDGEPGHRHADRGGQPHPRRAAA